MKMTTNNKFKKNTLDIGVDPEYQILLNITRKRLSVIARELTQYLEYLKQVEKQPQSSLNTLKSLILKLQ